MKEIPMRNTYENTPLVIKLYPKCGKFHAGHDPFYMRVGKSLENAEWVPVSNIRMDGEWIKFDEGEDHYRRWNRNSDILTRLIDSGLSAEWDGGLLRLPAERGFHMFNLTMRKNNEGCHLQS
ncbi:hypothetical protein JJQ73_06785 [Corynebacterium glutamicum]|nr:hypothetical protein JJQ73_06785 [Corynebacterium glutamicum]